MRNPRHIDPNILFILSILFEFLCVFASLWLIPHPLRFDRPVYSLYLVEHRVYALFASDHLRERYPRERVLDDLMQPDDHRPDAAIARMDAFFHHARIALAVLIEHVFIQHLDYLIQVDIFGRTRKEIAALRAARRIDESGLVQQPHQLARIRRRDTLTLRDLRQRQALARLKICQLHQTPQPVFFL